MSEAGAATEQAQALQDAALQNAYALLTQEVWAIAVLFAVGIGIGMCTVALYRVFFGVDLDILPPDLLRAERLRLTRIGAAASGLWTVGVEACYLAVFTDLGDSAAGLALIVFAATAAAIFAAVLNRPLFKPVQAVWRWALARLRKRIEQDTGAGSADDLNDSGTNQP